MKYLGQRAVIALAAIALANFGNGIQASPHGGGGGGSFNWGAAVGAAINAYSNSGGYGGHGGHGGHGGYGGGFGGYSGGGHGGHGGYSYPRTYNQPRVNMYTPTPSFSAPPSYSTPRTYSNPQTIPHTNTIPSNSTPQLAAPPKNALPQAKPAQQAAKPAPTKPTANTGLQQQIAELTPADIAKMSRQLNDRNRTLTQGILQALAAAVDQLIDTLPGAAQLTPENRQKLIDAINTGDADAVTQILDDANRNTPAGRQLVGRAAARRIVDRLLGGAAGGGITGADLARLIDAVGMAVTGDVLVNINIDIGRIAVNQQIIIWLAGAQPGAVRIPPGDNVVIALIPGLPEGTIIPLGFGPVLIGLGQPGDAIFLGQGNVTQIASGYQIAGPSVTEYAGQQEPTDVVLMNSGPNEFNYLVNQSQYSMQPTYRQNLGSGSWRVDFDRGGSYGHASYTVNAGYYEFAIGDKGWDLKKKSFKTRLENSNGFDFHYVLDNQRQMLAAHEFHELSGPMPPVVRFENGAGGYKQKRLDSKTYRVGLGEGALDIFPAESLFTPEAALAQTLPAQAYPAPSGAGPAVAGLSQPVAQTGGIKLPPGFTLFDPVAALQRDETVTAQRKLPAEFSLFLAAEDTAKSVFLAQ